MNVNVSIMASYKKYTCPVCGNEDIDIEEAFPLLRYNKRRMCLKCLIHKDDKWIRKYVAYSSLYTVFDRKAYAEIRGEL